METPIIRGQVQKKRLFFSVFLEILNLEKEAMVSATINVIKSIEE
tara:strand:+ start:52883 stop:53017 length:135 start_codon:yes stop_codon:yes gene_type:complete